MAPAPGELLRSRSGVSRRGPAGIIAAAAQGARLAAARRSAAARKAKRLGFTLSEIRDMLPSPGGRLQEPHSCRRDGFAADEAEPELALPPEQIVAQIGYLERQRNELDAAIAALRNVHRRMLELPGRSALA